MSKLNKFIPNKQSVLDVGTFILMTIAALTLVALVLFYVMPVKLASIKVPVATDKASYYQGQDVSGIFFGETYYTGEVRVLREVFCKNYKAVIDPPEVAADGDFYATQGRPRVFEGETIPIGRLPKDIPVGSNCVLQFTNIYNIQTPFGVRHEEYKYYTQNFAIITEEQRNELDSKAADANAQTELQSTTGGNDINTDTKTTNETNTTNNSTTNNTTTNTVPPVELKETCTINLLGIKVGCRQEAQ